MNTIPADSEVFAHGKDAKQGLDQLACQKSPEIAVYAKAGNDKKDKGKADKKTYHTKEEGESCFAESV